jgi:ADP-ribose pyrophosphatase
MTFLAPLPNITLELEQDLSPRDEGGFVRIVRQRLVARYPDGSRSAPFVYDAIERRALDVVVMAAHYVASGRRHVYLRSAVRPPLLLRAAGRLPIAPAAQHGLWELPAGLVEPDEETPAGVVEAARRELAEELGFDVQSAELRGLGPSSFPAPGLVGEQHIYFEVEVNPARRNEPSLDGSALEHGGEILAVPLDEALESCARGELPDAKTELALRRLRDRFA